MCDHLCFRKKPCWAQSQTRCYAQSPRFSLADTPEQSFPWTLTVSNVHHICPGGWPSHLGPTANPKTKVPELGFIPHSTVAQGKCCSSDNPRHIVLSPRDRPVDFLLSCFLMQPCESPTIHYQSSFPRNFPGEFLQASQGLSSPMQLGISSPQDNSGLWSPCFMSTSLTKS